ncbi:MAG: chromosome partitioning protein ParB [Bacillota bacterium]
MKYPHTPADVIRLASEGRLEEWIHRFLETDGNNLPMSDGLRLQRRYWIGPVVLPLARIQRCCGPEPTMEYVVDKDGWEQRVHGMIEGLRRGWAPPPFIAQFYEDGTFSLRDGNHRHEALRRAGREGYWCVIWCDSEALRQEAVRLLTP